MLLKSRYLRFIPLLALSILLMSWGPGGHEKINNKATLSFPPEMEQFTAWAATLAGHASDADDRKAIDPDEAPRHYIDIDNYQEFISNGRIPQAYDSVVALYGEEFVIGQGILPWATVKAYDSLVNSFLRHDWAKAVLFASDLGHYIADGHMPLHITRNYNGQYSGNTGIHNRYELTMISAFYDGIDYSGDSVSFVPDVRSYIFNYLYTNYVYADSVLAADDYAKSVDGNTSSDAYKEALWEKSRSFTVPLFSSSSRALAELIYTAWVEAGRPPFNSVPGVFDPQGHQNIMLLECSPNPFNEFASIKFSLFESSVVKLKVVNVYGIIIETLVDGSLPQGIHEFRWDTLNLQPGIYFLSIEAGIYQGLAKIVKIRMH